VTDRGYPPRQPDRQGRTRAPQEPSRRSGWQVIDAFDDREDDDANLPPWAVPGGTEALRPARRPPRPRVPDQRREPEPSRLSEPRRIDEAGDDSWPAEQPPGRLRRGPRRGRAAAARRRRSKRRLLTWGAVAVALVVLTGVGIFLAQSPAKKSPFVTHLQKGEFRAVPDACKVIAAAALHQVMGGAPRTIQPQQGQAQSECTFTVDATPVFRVLDVNMQALGASLVPVGNGNATANARYTFSQQVAQLRKPKKNSAQPPARTSPVAALGQQAVSAVQIFHDRAATEKVTVLARYRNVLVSVSLQGQSGHGFGPVTVDQLRFAALSVARAALARVKAEPVV
jgi:hypothetical protein